MSGVDRVRGAPKAPPPRRRRTDALALPPAESVRHDPVPPTTETAVAAAPEPRPVGPDPAFAAQVLGQAGQKRGLRGGPEVLQKAQATYLGAEWSGRADRRARKGARTKTDI